MKTKFGLPLILGACGAFISWTVMTFTSPFFCITLTAILFFAFGMTLAYQQPNNFKFGPAIMSLPVWIAFFMFFPLFFIAFNFKFIGNQTVSLLTGYTGMWLGLKLFTETIEDGLRATKTEAEFPKFLKILGVEYLFPIVLGFAGMLISLFAMMFSGMILQNVLTLYFPIYIPIYIIVFGAMAWLLVTNKFNWIRAALLICLLPALYFYILMPVKYGFVWGDWMLTSSGMLLGIPVTIATTLIIAFLAHRKTLNKS